MKKKFFIAFVLSSFMSFAQSLDNNLNDTEAFDTDDIELLYEENNEQTATANRDGVPFPGLPINDHLELLLVFGIAYAFIQIRKNKKILQ